MGRHFFASLLLLLFMSCTRKGKPTMFSIAEDCGIRFENRITDSKSFNVFKYRNFYNGGGVAVGDLDNDGLPEVFFTANEGANALYRNKGNFQFEDVSLKAGFGKKQQWSTGVVFADINADGWLDIYICNAGNMLEPALRRNQLFINNHDLTFSEKAAAFGLDDDGYSTQASFFDYDLDGDLDCFLVNNSPIPVNTLNESNMRDLPQSGLPIADFLKGGGDHLYRNEGGHYVEVTRQAGIHGGLISLGLGVNVADVNADGYTDVYVSNDFFERDYLYINQRNGTFRDELEQRIGHTSLSSMGADIQDINNDGTPDIFTTDMLPADDYRLKANTSFDQYDAVTIRERNGFYHQYTQNALQVNDGRGHFQETGFYSGVAASDWSWGALIFDADNDGLQDIYVSNGIYRDVTDQDFIDFFANDVVQQMVISGRKEEVTGITAKMPSNAIPNVMFRNRGGLKFSDEASTWGLGTPSFSNGAAYSDLDNDGDLDLVVNNVNQKAFVYRNHIREQSGANYVTLQLRYKTSNTFAIGSTIRAYQGDRTFMREIMPGRGFQSSVDYRQTIGLGAGGLDSITITWPDQTITVLQKPEVNHILTVDYASAPHGLAGRQTLLQVDSIGFAFTLPALEKHNEDDHVDFYFERNIPFLLSRQGPKAAAGDVNGDGREDLFIGGARNQASQLYLQTVNGYLKKPVPDFSTYAFQDVTAAFFFDCDKDKDLDLFIGGGGNFEKAMTGAIQNQLYINDGKGEFTLKRGALPPSPANCSTAFAFDYDNDGNPDIFAAGRSVPQEYGIDAACVLYHNDGGGNFRDVTATVAPDLLKAGMVTGAAWTDINGDKAAELILSGEWMHPSVFSYRNGRFQRIETGLEKYDGFWQSMTAADIDGDGDTDLVLGNLGSNFYLQPDSTKPVRLWMYDFDQNGTMDKIMSRTVDGKDMPVFTKREITEQIPALKKMNLKHHDYALRTVQELFPDDIGKSAVKSVVCSYSAIAYNDGRGRFTLRPLPESVQYSSLNTICAADVNADGYPDLLTGGNFYGLLPQFCRLDADKGYLLLNDGKGNFKPTSRVPGLGGEVRQILPLALGTERTFLYLINNQFPLFFRLTGQKPAGQTKQAN